MHLYFRELADALNDAGLDMRKTLKPEIEIPWTEESVKNHLWRPIQKIMTDVESTADLEKRDVSAIYDTLSAHLAKKFGIVVEFPHYMRYANGDKD